MKTKLLILLFAIVASSSTLFADGTKIGDLYYNLNAESKTAEVTFMVYNWSCNHDSKDHKYYNLISCDPDWVYWDIEVADIPSSITHNDMKYTVTSIGEHAFQNCSNLKSVTIPNTITSIGEDAFYNCSGLTTPLYNAHIFVRMPRSYSGAYTIPDGITSIFNSAFSGCSSLTSVTIPNSVTSIGNSAFYKCSGLTTVTIPHSVTSIENLAFFGCSGLTSIEIPNSVTSIGNFAFCGCSGLTSVTIPNSVTSIGEDAFYNCSGLTSITIPNSVTSIGERAFENCTGLTDIYATCGDLDRVKQLLNNDSRVKFAPSPYSVIVKANSGGNVAIPDYTSCDMTTQITATANPGYHFTQWNDGNTQNPRTISVTKDATYIASFAKNTYTISVKSGNTTMGTVSGSGTFEYLDQKQISATANYGYHFTQWNDGNTQNPRSVTITRDTTFRANFAKNTYSIMDGCNNTQGRIDGIGSFDYLSQRELTAVPNYGYHFVRWADGITTNPRTIDLTQDTTMIAIFNRNPVVTYNFDAKLGYVTGPETTPAGIIADFITFTASPLENCHFVKWLDGNKDNPRTIYLDRDTTMVAFFARNPIITYNYDASMGSIEGAQTTPTGVAADYISIMALPNNGYLFVKWADGNKDNPRTIYLDQDTTMEAIFDYIRSGKCGDDLALTWTYDSKGKALTISGKGTLNSNYTFGLEAPTLAEKLIIAEGVATVGNSAFAGYSTLKHLTVAASVETIYEQAFYNCSGLTEIYSYRSIPADAYSNTFDGISKSKCKLHVLSSAADLYGKATGWRDFYFVEPIDAEEVTEQITDVKVEPTDNTVEVTWPVEEQAATYTLEITKDGVLFCTLTFNANGQLTGIAFAPSRNGTDHQAPAAVKTSNGGLRFTVTGLDSDTNYHLKVNAKDSGDQVIATYNSDFTTTGVATGIDDQLTNDKCQMTNKVFRNGQILILRGEKVYTVTGQEVR